MDWGVTYFDGIPENHKLDRHTPADLAMALQLARLIERSWESMPWSEVVMLADWLRREVELELARMA